MIELFILLVRVNELVCLSAKMLEGCAIVMKRQKVSWQWSEHEQKAS